jgi:hypothetical protein
VLQIRYAGDLAAQRRVSIVIACSMRLPLALIALLLANGALAACLAASPTSPTASGDTRVTLAQGQSARAAGLDVRFVEVLQDSRCPTDVQCVWEGIAELEVIVSSGGRSTPHHLFVNQEPRSIVHEGVTLELVRLTPSPHSERPVQPHEYRATFAIRR